MAKFNGEYLAKMEDVLAQYALPYHPKRPVICFDERPCFLIEEVVEGMGLRAGQVRKEHYAYKKNASCQLLAAIEPLKGQRFAKVYHRRTAGEYTGFMQYLAEQYPEADKIIVIQDNLNTHKTGSFYEHLPAQEARDLAQKFEFHYTPKSASWLNMIEIEFSAMAKQCLHQRIPNKETLIKEVEAIVKERNRKQIKINWQFNIQTAREKLKNRYEEVNQK